MSLLNTEVLKRAWRERRLKVWISVVKKSFSRLLKEVVFLHKGKKGIQNPLDLGARESKDPEVEQHSMCLGQGAVNDKGRGRVA